MNIYVLNKQLEIVRVVDNYNSIIWTNRYYECGDFELYLSATPSLIYDLREDYILVREGYEDNAMIIENIKITTDVEEGNYLTVSGRCLKSILYRRIIWEQTQVKADIEQCITTLINKNVINPTDTSRKIDNLKLGNMIATETELSAQYTGDNLGETITSICQSFGLGWDILLNIEQKTFTFILYSGADRSYNQKENPWVVFSSEYDNLLSSEYTFSKQNYGNVTKVAGEGEGLARKYTTLGNASGLDRYEIYTDARDISTNDGQVTEEQYNEQLTEKGKEQLAESVKTETFSGEVLQYQYEYGKDYFLGDIVEVVNEYEMSAVSRITEVIESEDESGNYTIPTFSTWEGFKIVEPKEEREEHLFVPPPQVIEPPEPPKVAIECTFTGKEFNTAVKNVAYSTNKGLDNLSDLQYIDNYDFNFIKHISFLKLEDSSQVTHSKELQVVEKDGLKYKVTLYTLNKNGSEVYIDSNADILILPHNMAYMFYYLGGLTELDVSKFDTSKVTNMNSMFWGCENLTTLDLTNFDTSNVTDMGYMFVGCNTNFLDLTNFNTANVTDMRYMFQGCEKSTVLDVTNFNTSNVTCMCGMFEDCSNLISLNVSKFDTSKVTNMNSMFEECNNLTTLDLTNFATSNVTYMGRMFYGCEKLTTIDVSEFDTSKVITMNGMFEGCSNLTTINVSKFDTSKVTNMNSMFYGCEKLTTIDVSNFATSNVTDMGWMFRKCSNLTTLDLSNFVGYINEWGTIDVRVDYFLQGDYNLKSVLVTEKFVKKGSSNEGDILYRCGVEELTYV